MKQEELKEILTKMGYEHSTVFENPSYCDAAIGITDTGQVCYSYERMIQHLVNEDKMTEEEAIEFIDYNTVGALPYCNPSSCKPIIIYDLPFCE